MKRTITILAIALVALSACTETNLTPDAVRKGRQVQFITAPLKTTQTRAATLTSFDQSQTFGSTAYAVDESKSWSSSSTEATSTSIADAEIKYQNGVWRAWNPTTGEGVSYWWDDFAGKKLTFFSWYPKTFSNTLVNSGNLTITNQTKTTGSTVNYKDFNYTDWKVSATAGFGYTKDSDGNTTDGSVDLLLAKSADCTEQTSSNGVVTEFCHQLCNVKFLATVADQPENGERWRITEVKLSGIYTQADLVSTATREENRGVWSNHEASAVYTYTPKSEIELEYTSPTTFKEIFPQTLMIPQSVASSDTREPAVTITYLDKNGDTKTISAALATNNVSTWYAGKSITYRISISTKEYPIEFSGSVSGWDTGDSTDINIGTE